MNQTNSHNEEDEEDGHMEETKAGGGRGESEPSAILQDSRYRLLSAVTLVNLCVVTTLQPCRSAGFQGFCSAGWTSDSPRAETQPMPGRLAGGENWVQTL